MGLLILYGISIFIKLSNLIDFPTYLLCVVEHVKTRSEKRLNCPLDGSKYL